MLAVAEVAMVVFAVVLMKAVAVALLKSVCRYDRWRIAALGGFSAVAAVVDGMVMAVDGRGVGLLLDCALSLRCLQLLQVRR